MSWVWPVLLVLGNLAGVPLALVAWWTSFYFLSIVTWCSMLVSMPYHLCRNGGYCFFLTAQDWQSIDHVTATLQLAYFVLFFFLLRSSEQIGRTLRRRDVLETVYESERTHEDNMLYDAFSVSAVVIIFVWTVIQTYAHPTDSLLYINTLALTLLLGFFKYAVLDECAPTNLQGRLSWPELVIGIVLALVGIVLFALDYVWYELMHLLWHVFIYLGLFFIFLGLIRNTPHLSLQLQASYTRVRRCITCRCCFHYPEDLKRNPFL